MEKFKNILTGLLLASAAATPAMAKDVVITSPAEYQVIAISPNGKWAAGIYVDYSNSTYGFRWNLESNVTELLSSAEESFAYDVNNDGIVSGNFLDHSSKYKGQRPGYYKDGKWHGCELPLIGSISEGIGYGISSDGHYMSGSLKINGTYTAFIWKDGEIYKRLKPEGNGYDAMPYAISPDGQTAAGWCYLTKKSQRVATMWKNGEEGTAIDPYESIWSCARNFSPDGKKLLYWAGYNDTHADGHLSLKGVYDTTTGETEEIFAGKDSDCNSDFFDISDNGTIMGVAYGTAVVVKDGVHQTFEEFAKKEGIDLTPANIQVGESGDLVLAYGLAISANDNAMAVYYADKQRNGRTLVVRRGIDGANLAPAGVAATQLEGINAVRVSWHPAIGAEGVKGYNVYRDGNKLNTEIITDTKYYDKGLEFDQTYSYTVAAVQANDEETKAEEVGVTLATKQRTAPTGLYARQKGLNSAYLSWNEPASNFFPKGYIMDGDIAGFGSNQPNITMEAAIAFDGAEIACYEGCKVGKISFFPMSVAKAWKANLYTRDAEGALTLLYSQPITQELQYRQRNTVVLDNPVTVPSTGIIAAIEASIDDANVNVIGVYYGNTEPGYSDLVRMKEADADFYSLFELSSSSGVAMAVRWQIEIVMMPEGADLESDIIDHYSICDGDAEVATSKGTEAVVPNLADGKHQIGIKAVYANNNESESLTGNVTISSAYAPVSQVDIAYNGDIANFSWKAPKDDDNTYMTYANGSINSATAKFPSGTSEVMVGADFVPAKLKSYAGYAIESVKFYPLNDALFTVILLEDNKQVAEVEVEDYALNQMNTIALPEPVVIKPNCTYSLLIDCFDMTTQTIIAVDNTMPEQMVSDLYSINGGDFSSLYGDATLKGNWMIGLVIADPSGAEIPVNGYDIYVDGAKQNTETLTENAYAYDASTINKELERHTVSVDVYYKALTGVTKGDNCYFYYSASTPDNMIAEIKLQLANNYITVLGEGVEEVAAYAVNGLKVASVAGDTLPVSGFAPGVYVITVKSAQGTTSHKVKITK